MPAITLKPGREKSLLRRHPWIFSGALQKVDGEPASGDTLDLLSFKGQFLARAAYSPLSQIRARVWTFEDEPINVDFFRKRIKSAIQLRDICNLTDKTDSYRLVYAESDGLPGLIVDVYADTLVMQCLTTGAEYWREAVADILLEETGFKTIYERSDTDARALEGLPARVGRLRGTPERTVIINEHGLRYRVNLESGHKTGFYLDQRSNRQRLRALARGREMLDGFCYSGGFTLNALAGEAKSVVAVEASAEALALARQNVELNGLSADQVDFIQGDMFHVLRKFRDEGRSFDLIVLDPPKFAPTSAQLEKAARGYKDINLLAFKLLRPAGILVTFSCSGGVDALLFQKIVASAALDAGIDAQIVDHLSQACDHPVALNFPEGSYLKGLVCLRK
jgi:23S rRNA (cytosine1962-C5)-methyltransferase